MPIPYLVPLLAGLILVGYVASLWWLLRRETLPVLLVVAILCVGALAVRLLFTTDFPAGLNEDEVKTLGFAMRGLAQGHPGRMGPEAPLLLNVLFQAPMVAIVGPTRWAIRIYPLAASVLATAAAFATARAMRLRVAPSLAAGGLMVVLPWSLLYGRIAFGGEMTFHQLLLLAALARLVWMNGGSAEMAIGALGLSLLMYDYTAGLSMLAMPIVAAVIARGWRRALCLAVSAAALSAWLPFFLGLDSPTMLSQVTDKVPTAALDSPATHVWKRVVVNLTVLTEPRARNGWLTVSAAAVHPLWILGIAVIGAFTGLRRALFLWGGFLAAMVPSAFSEGDQPSTHRMLMMFPFIPLAAACVLDVRWRIVRGAACVVVVGVAAVQSMRFYYSPAFWNAESVSIFDPERTKLVEALPWPPHPRLILAEELAIFFFPRAQHGEEYETLSVDNWIPPDGTAAIYGFGARSAALRPFYEQLLGYRRVEGFGRAFLVRLESREWSWLRNHGWTYEAHCGPEVRRAHVLALFKASMFFDRFPCAGSVRHVWRGRWAGPTSRLRLYTFGTAVVELSDGQRFEGGRGEAIDFTVDRGLEVTVTVDTEHRFVDAALVELTPVGERVPSWENIDPLPSPEPPGEPNVAEPPRA